MSWLKQIPKKDMLFYGGQYFQSTSNGKLLGWKGAGDLMAELEE